MKTLDDGEIDERTGKPAGGYGNWTEHPNNPSVAAE
jgi:dihydropyrimidine dehydrogenase (NAD+) subunit PreA